MEEIFYFVEYFLRVNDLYGNFGIKLPGTKMSKSPEEDKQSWMNGILVHLVQLYILSRGF